MPLACASHASGQSSSGVESSCFKRAAASPRRQARTRGGRPSASAPLVVPGGSGVDVSSSSRRAACASPSMHLATRGP
eukprot:scaffold7746_cov59-Phaeocystis_antarctica.AAC.6